MKHLLIVYHTQSGNTGAMAQAAYRGATSEDIDGVETKLVKALDAGLDELLWADALMLGTPENFGYMAGALKDFLDRTYYPAQGKVDGLPFTVFISAGNDGTGALNAIQRIARGYPLREVQDAVIARGELTTQDIDRCEELGMAMAAGLELGVF